MRKRRRGDGGGSKPIDVKRRRTYVIVIVKAERDNDDVDDDDVHDDGALITTFPRQLMTMQTTSLPSFVFMAKRNGERRGPDALFKTFSTYASFFRDKHC